MKQIIILSFFITSFCFSQKKPLFKITENRKTGYINIKGETIINPIYNSGNDFSENLASVRLNGYYGFIDENATFVIPPIYDMAFNFNKGIANVFKNGIPLFINKKNEQVIDQKYKSLIIINSTKGIVKTYSKKEGIIDLITKKLIVDTIYGRINPPYKGLSVVSNYLPKNSSEKDRQLTILDSLGNVVVPFGTYYQIRDFKDDYTLVRMKNSNDEKDKYDGAIDLKGKLLFKRPQEGYDSYIEGDFLNGLAKIILCKKCIYNINDSGKNFKKRYQGYIDVNGNIVYNDTLNKFVSDFIGERAYTVSYNKNINLIDTNFKRINKDTIGTVYNTFDKGYGIFYTKSGWGIMSKNGDYIVNPTFNQISEFSLSGDFFFYSNGKVNNEVLYGIANTHSNIILEPIMNKFDDKGFINGLLSCQINEMRTYVNNEGEIIWQEKTSPQKELQNLNIDYMRDTYYYVSSSKQPIKLNNDWYKNYSFSQPITKDIPFEKNNISITIDPKKHCTYNKIYLGCKLYISNNMDKLVEFPTQDSNLYIKFQAQDENNDWKYIEYTGNSTCGNSYYNQSLDANHFWEFNIPVYEGDIKTKIRAELQYLDNANNLKIIYSNVIDGNVNPAQFWNNYEYYFD